MLQRATMIQIMDTSKGCMAVQLVVMKANLVISSWNSLHPILTRKSQPILHARQQSKVIPHVNTVQEAGHPQVNVAPHHSLMTSPWSMQLQVQMTSNTITSRLDRVVVKPRKVYVDLTTFKSYPVVREPSAAQEGVSEAGANPTAAISLLTSFARTFNCSAMASASCSTVIYCFTRAPTVST